MSDTSNDQEQTPEHIAQLRAAADENPNLRSQNAAKDREIQFLQHGVNTSTLLGKNVMTQHGDKEITAEAIAETVAAVRTELGLTDEVTPPGTTPEQELIRNQQTLHGNAVPPGTEPVVPPKDLIDIAADTYESARRGGIGEIEAQEAAIGAIIREGALGNAPAAWDADRYNTLRAEHGHGAEYAGLPERSYAQTVQQTK